VKFNVALYLTEAYICKGNHTEAFNILRAAESKDSDLASPWSYENVLTGVPEEAELPSSSVMFLNMATLNFLTDNLDAAESCIEQAGSVMRASGDNDALTYALIYLNLRKGDFESALKVIKKRRVSPSQSDLSSDLKICY
jgi:hypothetical protein